MLCSVSFLFRARAHTQQLQSQQNNDRVEVIKLPPTITSNGAYNLSKSASTTKETSAESNEWAGLNFSSKVSNASSTDEGDAPLNLCMKSSSDSSSKPADMSSNSSNSLQNLSSITAALGSGGGNDRMRE